LIPSSAARSRSRQETSPSPVVDADDIADVAVAALTESGHAGQIYELTGPRPLTFEEALGEISRAAGREIRYVPVSVKEYASMLTEHELPVEFVTLLVYLFTEVLDGRNAHLTDGIRRALGREPRDFADYARETAATGVWNAAVVDGEPHERRMDHLPPDQGGNRVRATDDRQSTRFEGGIK
jgi:uncharacterized protein YbjT (DUF2867 family)